MSAIDDMMAVLARPPVPVGQGPTSFGQGPMNAVQSSQMPQFQPPPIQSPHTGLIDRVKGHLGELLGSAKSSAPAGYEGLLSSDEMQQAQPGVGNSILGRILGLGSDVFNKADYTNRLDHVLALKDLRAKKMAEATNAARQDQHDALRMQVGNVLADTSMDPQTRYANLTKLMGTAFSIGDDKSMGAIANAMQSAKPPVAPAAKEYEPKPFTLGGKIVWVKPGADVPDGAKPFHEPNAAPQPILITGTDANGNPTFGLVDKGTAQARPITGMSPKVSTGASSAQNAASEALLRSSVSEMGNADKFMREYEQGLKDKRYSINGLSQFLGGLGNAFTHDDPASRAIQNTALTALNKTNPDLARYIRRGLSFAEGEAGISKRPSDFRTKMATFLSTVASGASGAMIDDIQGRRNSILTPLHGVIGRMDGSQSKGSGSEKGTTQSYEEWKKAHGH